MLLDNVIEIPNCLVVTLACISNDRLDILNIVLCACMGTIHCNLFNKFRTLILILLD